MGKYLCHLDSTPFFGTFASITPAVYPLYFISMGLKSKSLTVLGQGHLIMNKPIRILIADNDLEFSKNLKCFLDKQTDIKVVDIVRDGQGTVSACKEALPDVVLIDLHLPVLDSIKTIQSITTQNERIKILGVSSIPDDRYAIAAVKAGARGYVEKNCSGNYVKIANAIRQVANGEVVLNSTLASHILQEFS